VTAPAIAPAGTGDAAAIADLVAEAFHPLAASAWLAPDPAVRARLLSGQFTILAEHALAHGEVYWAGDREGVAVWFPRVAPVPEPPDYDRRLAAACGEATPRFRVLDSLLEENHPTEPHHHLAFLAVTPSRQGRGLGTALLRQHHAVLDRDGLPAYLEASSERNRRLYQRHGYREQPPLRLPDGTAFWPMWRPPSPGTGDG
jgi:GNAT superfamily N-acetyltransferase